MEEVERALDEQLLPERVADLDRRPLAGPAGPVPRAVEALAGQDADPTDPVAAGPRAEQHDEVALAGRAGQVQVLVPQGPDAQRVNQRVALVAGVEVDLAADVRQAEAVAVAADARDHAVHETARVGVVDGTEAQRVHDRDGPGAHGDDVADDAADPGRGALVRLDEARVVVRLRLEGDGPAVADVDDAGILADASEQGRLPLGDRGAGGLAEARQVDLARLVRAVLRPHDGVHGELGGGRPAAEDRPDPVVLVGLQTQRGPRLLDVRGGGRGGDGVHGGAGRRRNRGGVVGRAAHARAPCNAETNTRSPSVLGP